MYASDDNPLFGLYRPLFTGPRAAWVDARAIAGQRASSSRATATT